MKKTEIRLLLKAILPKLENHKWVLHEEKIIIEPVGCILKGIHINKSGLDKSQFELKYFVQPLYVPDKYLNLSYGSTLRNIGGRQWWDYDFDKIEEISNQISILINKIDKAFLLKISDANDFYSYFKKDKKLSFRFFEAVAYSSCYSKNVRFKEDLSDLLAFLEKKENRMHPYAQFIYKNTQKLILSETPESILEEWVLETKLALKLPR
jgi:hypothetical protein